MPIKLTPTRPWLKVDETDDMYDRFGLRYPPRLGHACTSLIIADNYVIAQSKQVIKQTALGILPSRNGTQKQAAYRRFEPLNH
jgi:phage tail protein X